MYKSQIEMVSRLETKTNTLLIKARGNEREVNTKHCAFYSEPNTEFSESSWRSMFLYVQCNIFLTEACV